MWDVGLCADGGTKIVSVDAQPGGKVVLADESVFENPDGGGGMLTVFNAQGDVVGAGSRTGAGGISVRFSNGTWMTGTLDDRRSTLHDSNAELELQFSFLLPESEEAAARKRLQQLSSTGNLGVITVIQTPSAVGGGRVLRIRVPPPTVSPTTASPTGSPTLSPTGRPSAVSDKCIGVLCSGHGSCVDKRTGGCNCDRGWRIESDCSLASVVVSLDENTTECAGAPLPYLMAGRQELDIDMCKGICIYMRIDMYRDVCTHVYTPADRHMDRHEDRRMYRHRHGHVPNRSSRAPLCATLLRPTQLSASPSRPCLRPR